MLHETLQEITYTVCQGLAYVHSAAGKYTVSGTIRKPLNLIRRKLDSFPQGVTDQPGLYSTTQETCDIKDPSAPGPTSGSLK